MSDIYWQSMPLVKFFEIQWKCTHILGCVKIGEKAHFYVSEQQKSFLAYIYIHVTADHKEGEK